MRQLGLLKHLGNQLGIFNGGGANQHRLTALITFANVVNRSLVFLGRGFVHTVQLVFTAADAVRWNHHRFKAVNFLELVGLGVGRTRHATQFLVETEIVLERDGRQGLVFSLNLNAFFGFYRLMQTIAPTTTGHQAAREFVNDGDFTVLAHVMLISVIQMVGAQRSVQMVHQADVGRVVQRRAFSEQALRHQNTLGIFMTLFGHEHLVRFFIHREVTGCDDALARAWIFLPHLARQKRHHFVDGDVQLGVIFRLTTDDQRCACLIDQDGVHFVHDGKVQFTLHTVLRLVDHVVAQIVKAVFVVGAVSDVCTISRLLFIPGHLRQVDTDRQAQVVVKAGHPLGITAGQVIVHRHHVHALIRQGVQVDGQSRRECLAFTGAHLSDLALV